MSEYKIDDDNRNSNEVANQNIDNENSEKIVTRMTFGAQSEAAKKAIKNIQKD